MKIGKYILEITVFICGGVVMIFEIVGSRVLAPFLGTSIFVWTSLIGVILGSLSVGYWFGGKIADKYPKLQNLSIIIFCASISIGIMTIIKSPLLFFLRESIPNIKYSSVVASLILFAPASILLGMVTPYAVKLKIKSLDESGSTVGNLFAVSTIGSIIGTFLAGFYLIPKIGTTKLLILLSLILAVTSVGISLKHFLKIKLYVIALIFLGFCVFNILTKKYEANGFFDIDTNYSRVWIHNYEDFETGQSVKRMMIDGRNSSAIFVGNNELVHEQAKYYHLAKHFNPNFKNALMIGGATYAFPENYLETYPNAKIDVVEIDPQITELAKKYFNLKENPRLNIYHEDARTYLHRTQKKYDVIFGDAFTSQCSVPYQLTTKEAIQRKYDILNDDGIVVLNLISAIEGDSGKFLRAEYSTYKDVFPQVYLFPVRDFLDGEETQNIILIALKSETVPIFESDDFELNQYFRHLWKKDIILDIPILTDDFAPVDYYTSKTI